MSDTSFQASTPRRGRVEGCPGLWWRRRADGSSAYEIKLRQNGILGSHTLPEATGDTLELLNACRVLLGSALPTIERRGITLIGITFSNLSGDDAVQMALPFDGLTSTAIDSTLDGIRERFGSKAVTRGVLLGRPDGMQVPLLPD